MTKLTPQDVQRLYAKMLKKGLAPRTVLHTHRLLSQSLKHAMKWGMVIRNVCEAVDPPRPTRIEMQALDTDDVQRLLEATKQSDYGAVFYLLVYAGLRRGEVLGIRWRDVDLKSKTVSINENVIRIKGKGVIITKPKTKLSRRLISFSPSAAALLSGLKNRRREQFEAVGLGWDEAGFVFCNSDGGPMSPDTISHNFKKIIKEAGLPNIRLHDLRHTHATIMLKQGVHPKIVSERLGHSSINITLDTYSHVLPGMQERAVMAFEEALHPNPQDHPNISVAQGH